MTRFVLFVFLLAIFTSIWPLSLNFLCHLVWSSLPPSINRMSACMFLRIPQCVGFHWTDWWLQGSWRLSFVAKLRRVPFGKLGRTRWADFFFVKSVAAECGRHFSINTGSSEVSEKKKKSATPMNEETSLKCNVVWDATVKIPIMHRNAFCFSPRCILFFIRMNIPPEYFPFLTGMFLILTGMFLMFLQTTPLFCRLCPLLHQIVPVF